MIRRLLPNRRANETIGFAFRGAPIAEIRAAFTRESDGRPVGVAGAVPHLIEDAQ